MESKEPNYESSYHQHRVDVMSAPDDHSIWSSNELSSTPMYITVDTNEAFPEMPPTVVIDSESMMLDSGQVMDHDQNVIYVDSAPINYTISENQQFEFQGKISVVESTNSHGLFCGECSARLESPVSFFQHWVTHHCQLEQPAPPLPTEDINTSCGAATTLTMERCNRCNHIFVEGTQRYKDHLLTCELAPSTEVITEKMLESLPTAPQGSTGVVSGVTGGTRTKRLKSGHGGHTSSNKYVCGVCNAGVKTVTSFFLHWLESHQGLRDILQEVWQCRGCSGSKLFPDCISLQEHVSSDHPSSKTKEEHILSCPIPDCLARLQGEEGVGTHLGQFHRHLLQDENVVCPACPSVFNCTKEAYDHFRNEHLVTCTLCSCDIDKDSSRDHYLSQHRCEVIWNRTHSLQKVSKSPQVSRICTGAHQGPVRLANGAIAKTVSVKRDVTSSTAAPVKSSKYTLLRGDSSDPTEEKGYKCAKCTQVFTNLKVMERHYLSNHEFQCKFCSAVMDKDVYGQHLRQHLASERRKTIPTSIASSSSATTSSSINVQAEETSVQIQLYDCN